MDNKQFWILVFLICLVVALNTVVYKEVLKATKLSDYGVNLNTDTVYPPLEQIEVIN